jgi:hypothetical protein
VDVGRSLGGKVVKKAKIGYLTSKRCRMRLRGAGWMVDVYRRCDFVLRLADLNLG